MSLPCSAQSASNTPATPVLVAESSAAAGSSSAAEPAAGAAAGAQAAAAPSTPPSAADLEKRIEVLEADLKARNVVQPGDEDPNTNKEPIAPFSDADWSWLQGMPHNHDEPLATKHFVPEIRVAHELQPGFQSSGR